MKHQQFEEWLLTEEKLSSSQEVDLVMHLEACQSCNEFATAARAMQSAFKQTEYASPEPGFTARWEQNLESYHYQRRSWRGWFLLSLTVAFMMSTLLAAVFPTITSPVSLISEFLVGFASWAGFVSGLFSALESFGRLLPQISPALLFSVINFSLVILVTIWLIALKQFAYKKEFENVQR